MNVQTQKLRRRAMIVLIGFLLIAGFFLVTEHTAHFLGALPYLILLACPLMHLFMHHGHGGHPQGHDAASGGAPAANLNAPVEGEPR